MAKEGYCDNCKTHSFNVHIHHKDRKHANSNKDNLQTLCAYCHGKEHGIEGANAREHSFDMVDYYQPQSVGYRLKAGFNLISQK